MPNPASVDPRHWRTAGKTGVGSWRFPQDAGDSGLLAADALDPVQRHAVQGEHSVLLLGAAGTGKTTALIRAAVEAARRSGAGSVLALARNREAARRWQGQAARELGGIAPSVQTVAAVAATILADAAGAAEGPRVLTAPEQEMRVREVLRGSVESGSVPWPSAWKTALPTRAFAHGLRRALASTRRLGWDPDELERVANAQGDEGWAAIARFCSEYLQVLDWEGALDQVEVVLRARRLVESGATTRYRGVVAVLADDVHTWDCGEARLVLALTHPLGAPAGPAGPLQRRTGGGSRPEPVRLVAAADPDQCTGSYRGADLAAMTLVREHVQETLTCPQLHRGSAATRDARAALMGQRWYAGLPTDALASLRGPAVVASDGPAPAEGSRAGGRPERIDRAGPERAVPGAHGERSNDGPALLALEFDDAHAQARHLAALLHQRHGAGVAWREMAVLATRPREELGLLARGLAQAGVPVSVPITDVALAEQSAVATLVAAAELTVQPPEPGSAPASEDRVAGAVAAVAARASGQPLGAAEGSVGGRSETRFPGRPLPAEDVFERLLTSDLGAIRPREVRRVQRWLRSQGAEPRLDRLARDTALAEQVPEDLQHVVAAAAALQERIAAARAAHERDATPAEILWELWLGVPDPAGRNWPERLRQRAAATGEAALAADRELDAVLQLFRLAERAPARWGGRRALRALLEEVEHQDIPAEPDLSAASHADRVEVLSLHRAQGRTWRVAVVTGLAASAWEPTALGEGIVPVHRLTEDALLTVAPPPSNAEQRRLFNVALSRGDETLILASCGGPSDPPTGHLAEAGLTVRRVHGGPPQPHGALDVMLELRSRAAVPGSDRQAAAEALAVLLGARGPGGHRLFPGMQPDRWPGAQSWTVAAAPLRPDGAPLLLSGSGVAALAECPLRWFLQREARGDRPSGALAQFGLVVHAAAAELVSAPRAEPDAVDALLAQYWSAAGYEAAWQEAQERDRAAESLRRVLSWLASRTGALTAEVPLDEELAVVDDAGAVVDRVRVRGRVDVVESRKEERLVWDFKTGRAAPSLGDAKTNPQLATYQLALRNQQGPPLAGAGLVHLCLPAGRDAPEAPLTRMQPGVDGNAATAEHADALLRRAAAVLRAEQFPATPNSSCRTCPFARGCPARSRPAPSAGSGGAASARVGGSTAGEGGGSGATP